MTTATIPSIADVATWTMEDIETARHHHLIDLPSNVSVVIEIDRSQAITDSAVEIRPLRRRRAIDSTRVQLRTRMEALDIVLHDAPVEWAITYMPRYIGDSAIAQASLNARIVGTQLIAMAARYRSPHTNFSIVALLDDGLILA